MPTIESIVRSINRDLTPQFEERLRAALAEQDREWLIDQIVRLTLDAHSLEEIDRRVEVEAKARARSERLERVRALRPRSRRRSRRSSTEFGGVTRESADRRGRAPRRRAGEGHRPAGARPPDRRRRGAAAARQGHAVRAAVRRRVDQHAPRARPAGAADDGAARGSRPAALDFMRASTELAAAGTWQDPESVSSDERADNVLLEVQFGETADEIVGPRDRHRADADQQPRGQRAGALRADDQRRGDDADRLTPLAFRPCPPPLSDQRFRSRRTRDRARAARRRVRALSVRPRARGHGRVLRGLRLRPGRLGEHDRRRRQGRPAALRRMRRPRHPPPRRQSGRPRAGSARARHRSPAPRRPARSRATRSAASPCSACPRTCRSSWTPRSWSEPRIVLGGGSRRWKVIARPQILLALPNVEVVEVASPAPAPPREPPTPRPQRLSRVTPPSNRPEPGMPVPYGWSSQSDPKPRATATLFIPTAIRARTRSARTWTSVGSPAIAT